MIILPPGHVWQKCMKFWLFTKASVTMTRLQVTAEFEKENWSMCVFPQNVNHSWLWQHWRWWRVMWHYLWNFFFFKTNKEKTVPYCEHDESRRRLLVCCPLCDHCWCPLHPQTVHHPPTSGVFLRLMEDAPAIGLHGLGLQDCQLKEIKHKQHSNSIPLYLHLIKSCMYTHKHNISKHTFPIWFESPSIRSLTL